jgi:ABC-type Mn2+/Zn2+ transport system ATPase subunit
MTCFFLKIDIEGSEYRILDDLIKLQKKLCGVVIEFHNIDLFLNKIKRFINLNKLQLIHIHANNVGILLNDNNIIELTFAKNPETIGTKIKFPNELDQPNLKNLPEIKLNFI